MTRDRLVGAAIDQLAVLNEQYSDTAMLPDGARSRPSLPTQAARPSKRNAGLVRGDVGVGFQGGGQSFDRFQRRFHAALLHGLDVLFGQAGAAGPFRDAPAQGGPAVVDCLGEIHAAARDTVRRVLAVPGRDLPVDVVLTGWRMLGLAQLPYSVGPWASPITS